jgi:hypothetical protein
MRTVFSKLHFGKDKTPKTLKVSIEHPSINQQYGSLKEGGVVISIMAKDASQGFLLNTGDTGDLIYALERALSEIRAETFKLAVGVR